MTSDASNVENLGERSAAITTSRQARRRLRYLASLVRPHRKVFLIQIISNITRTAVSLAIPLCFRFAIDRGITKHDFGQVQLYVALALGATLVWWLCAFIEFRSSIGGLRVLNDLRTNVFVHVQKQGLDFFHKMKTGVVISRLTNDIDAMENLIIDGVFMVFSAFLTLVGIEVIMFVWLDAHLALAVNAVFPFMLIATILFRYYSTRAYKLTRERMALVTAFLAESLAGMRIVQAFAAEKRVAREFDATNERYRKANMQTIYLSALYFPGIELISAIATGIVLWYGGYLNSHQLISLGMLFAFIAYLNDFFDPIQQLSQFYSSFLSAMAALDKIMIVMETTPTIVDAPDARQLETLRGEIRFDNVSFSYFDGAPEVLHGIDLHIPAGQTIALVGHTGAGKSTFVKLLSRFHDPTHGSVSVDNVDIRNLQAVWFRSRLGIVPQEGFLFSATVTENIRFGRPEASDEDVINAAKTVGAHEFILELENGYDTEVGERGNQLSAGQRQLLAFARALLADPSMLVLDEATSSVDVATELRLADGLKALVAGRTAIIVAHRLSTIRDADRIVVIDDGRIVEQGTHEELLESDGFYSDLYGSWSGEAATIEAMLDPS